MADTFIDYDETRIYGDYTIEQVTRLVAGRLREFDPALQFAVTSLRAATDIVAGHLHAARSANPALHTLMAAREAPMREGRDTLLRFARHLESHRAGQLPYDRFFVDAPETLSHRGTGRLLAAFDHVLGTLDEHRAAVREADHWRAELSAAREGLEHVVTHDRALRAHDVTTPTLAAAREHWLTVYEATKHLVSAALSLSGAGLALDEIFDDLAATHRAEGAFDDVVPAEPVTPAELEAPPEAR